MVCEIVESSSRRQFLTDLGDRRVGGVPPRPTDTRQTAVTGVEVGDHFTMVAVLADLEPHVPMASCGSHDPIVKGSPRRRQSTTSRPVSAGDRRDRSLVLGDASEMAVDVGVAGVVGGDRQVGRPEVAPFLGVPLPPLG